jgi:hypothetical protein
LIEMICWSLWRREEGRERRREGVREGRRPSAHESDLEVFCF